VVAVQVASKAAAADGLLAQVAVALEETKVSSERLALQTLVVVVVALTLLVLVAQVVQAMHELLFGVNYGTTLRIS
jgi:hypothetical protein